MTRGPAFHHCPCGHATRRAGASLPLACERCGQIARSFRGPPPGAAYRDDGRGRLSLGDGGYRLMPRDDERDID
jgi:hypothetical protein